MKKLSDQECRGETIRLNLAFNTLDQNLNNLVNVYGLVLSRMCWNGDLLV